MRLKPTMLVVFLTLAVAALAWYQGSLPVNQSVPAWTVAGPEAIRPVQWYKDGDKPIAIRLNDVHISKVTTEGPSPTPDPNTMHVTQRAGRMEPSLIERILKLLSPSDEG